MSEEKKDRLVGHQYAIAFDLGNGRSITVNGNLYRDAEAAEMNGEMDRIMTVLERQRARCEVEMMLAELEQREQAYRSILIGIQSQEASIEAEKKAHPNKLHGKDESALVNLRLKALEVQKDIERGREKLVELRQKAA